MKIAWTITPNRLAFFLFFFFFFFWKGATLEGGVLSPHGDFNHEATKFHKIWHMHRGCQDNSTHKTVKIQRHLSFLQIFDNYMGTLS